MIVNKQKAKEALDSILTKSRVHLYKPIQIAEILYHHRTDPSNKVKLENLETYRSVSKKWRDDISVRFLGTKCSSSAKFQDNLFEGNAIHPEVLKILGVENKASGGAVEAYIYKAFENKHLQLENALKYCLDNDKTKFKLDDFLNKFWLEPGLKRSLDKIFEIVVYSLFEVLVTSIEVKIDVHYNEKNKELLIEFSEFADKVLNLSQKNPRKTLDGHFYRVGVTNAADRGLDMFANFGSVVQVKHLSLDPDLAESITTSVTSDRIIIVCKSADSGSIKSILTQIGWGARIQSIVTIDELNIWYEKALRGKYADVMGDKIITSLSSEIKNEFPSVGNSDFIKFKEDRGYDKISDSFWL